MIRNAILTVIVRHRRGKIMSISNVSISRKIALAGLLMVLTLVVGCVGANTRPESGDSVSYYKEGFDDGFKRGLEAAARAGASNTGSSVYEKGYTDGLTRGMELAKSITPRENSGNRSQTDPCPKAGSGTSGSGASCAIITSSNPSKVIDKSGKPYKPASSNGSGKKPKPKPKPKGQEYRKWLIASAHSPMVFPQAVAACKKKGGRLIHLELLQGALQDQAPNIRLRNAGEWTAVDGRVDGINHKEAWILRKKGATPHPLVVKKQRKFSFRCVFQKKGA
uniref:Uncharacterized protein n=1 Tax=Candidatus Kentrum sp. MB TaxID=2138164 RepID=A0A451BD20_9GAMM|nr:MAG: hypothetical protein BECKMB1821G_GA0114241_10564 [Candidatus Kentron sp. MB]VFK31933.1 MAG: hypothetical protein BECKMB1821I_GA0114274_102822 [Candidatus Kentron sp. MB]VFK76182.1 MAG: hypothetical protein BECKMB1821H_GA0114242_104514 [Candidatus Kentron sp. MB]